MCCGSADRRLAGWSLAATSASFDSVASAPRCVFQLQSSSACWPDNRTEAIERMSDQIDNIEGLSDGEVRKALEDGRLTAYAAERRQITSTDGLTEVEITRALAEGRLDDYLATRKNART
jgi:hypothetical protein